MGPHPAVAQVRSAVRTALARASDTVVVACSGGADSVALAAAVAFEAPRVGRRAGLVTVDHGLQSGSCDQAARVATFGYELGLDPVEIIAVDVSGVGGPEAAARRARYEALDGTSRAWDADIFLGHTLDDQAETVLLGLGRGSGPRSIGGMRPRTARLVRPLLGVRRAVTVAACAALGLDVWDDPHNADPSFQRVRLRAEVLPLLEDVLQGGVAEALARTASLLQDDLDALDELSGISTPSATPGGGGAGAYLGDWTMAELAGLPRAVRSRMLREWLLPACGDQLSAGHITAVDALITDWHGQGPLDLPGGIRVSRASGRLKITHP